MELMNTLAIKEKVTAIIERKLLEALAEAAQLLQQRVGIDVGGNQKITEVVAGVAGSFAYDFHVRPGDTYLKAATLTASPITLPASRHER